MKSIKHNDLIKVILLSSTEFQEKPQKKFQSH